MIGGTYTPHCARVDPGQLVRGLATACERRGVAIYERSAALSIAPGRVDVSRRQPARGCRRAGNGGLHEPAPRRATPLPPPCLAHAGDRAPATRGLGRDRLDGMRPDRRSALPVRLRTANTGRAHRPRRAGTDLQARWHDQRSGRGAARDPRPTRAGPAATLPGRSEGAGDPPLGRLLRCAARLEHERPLRSRHRSSRGPEGTRATASSPRVSPGGRWPT